MIELKDGESGKAWDLFVERYRRLILATIRALLSDPDDVMDVFSCVCHALIADDFARLTKYSANKVHAASVSTWLVTVVRNLTLDWLRKRDGRARSTTPAFLSPLHRDIHKAICSDGLAPAEAFERICSSAGSPMLFHQFLREVQQTQRLAPCVEHARTRFRSSLSTGAEGSADSGETLQSSPQLSLALATQPQDVQVAIELFVVERMSAEDVARVVGWPNAKSVYNRVRRGLEAVRQELERRGLERGDL